MSVLTPKPPTPQGVSCLLANAGFTRALNGFAIHVEHSGYLVRRRAPGVVVVEHIGLLSRAPGGHLADLNRYMAAITKAGYRCEQTGANLLVVTAEEAVSAGPS